jgi:hypothetical protein
MSAQVFKILVNCRPAGVAIFNLRSVPYTKRSLNALLLTPRTVAGGGSGSRERA